MFVNTGTLPPKTGEHQVPPTSTDSAGHIRSVLYGNHITTHSICTQLRVVSGTKIKTVIPRPWDTYREKKH